MPFKGESLSRKGTIIFVDYFGEKSSTATLSVSSFRTSQKPALDLPKVEKTTLGDLSALAELKASLEAAEEKPAKKAAKKDAE